MKTTVSKKFDCVKSVRKVREKSARELDGKSEKEILDYYKTKRSNFSLFRYQLDLVPEISSIYVASPQGGLYNLGREVGDLARYHMYTQNFQAGTLYKVSLEDGSGNPRLLARIPDFDSRNRFWYSAALESPGIHWNPPYLLATGQDRALALSSALRNFWARSGNTFCLWTWTPCLWSSLTAREKFLPIPLDRRFLGPRIW